MRREGVRAGARRRGVRALAGVLAVAGALSSVAGCGSAPSRTEPARAGAPRSDAPGSLASPLDAATTIRPGAVERRRTGAAARVPRAVILEQLRRSAERIAQRMASEAPLVVPGNVDPQSNRGLGYQLMLDFGFPADQWRYLDALWQRESGWNHLAENPRSGAYGIPQSLPGAKMSVVGADWRTNPETQIRWGLAYIASRYGNPQQAWEHSQRRGWY